MLGTNASIVQRGGAVLIHLRDLCKITCVGRKRTRTQIQDSRAGAHFRRTHRPEASYLFIHQAAPLAALLPSFCSLFPVRLVNVTQWWHWGNKWTFSSAAFNGIEWRWTSIRASVSDYSSLKCHVCFLRSDIESQTQASSVFLWNKNKRGRTEGLRALLR